MSKPDYQQLPTRLGIYTLTRHIGSAGEAELYLANQSHVERGVVVEALPYGSNHEVVERFLASARARVSVHLPHVTQVFESMVSDDIWYLTQERPEGRNIARVAQEKEGLTATQVCLIIEAAAALYNAAVERNVAAGGLPLHAIYLGAHSRVSFLSPVCAGEHVPELVEQQQRCLAGVLRPLLPKQGKPGLSRVATLLDWLANGYEGERLEWAALADTAATVREQLAPQLRSEHVAGLHGKTRGAVVRQSKRNRRKLIKTAVVASIGAAVALAAAIAGIICAPSVGAPLPANDGDTILCSQGNETVKVAVRPVSIREYRQFLLDFESENKLNRDQRRHLQTGVPKDSTSRRPADWDAQWDAANNGKKYNGTVLTPDSPVRGVSYWDALVYARYKGAELPSARVLMAAREQGGAEVSVCEWTTTLSRETGIYKAGTIILPSSKDEEAILEPNQSTRDIRYGFRLVYP